MSTATSEIGQQLNSAESNPLDSDMNHESNNEYMYRPPPPKELITDDDLLSDIPVPPDGGWGWMVVLASFLIHVVADGITYSFGIFLPEFVAYFDGGRADVSLLGSLLPGITLLSGPIASTLTNKYGCRVVTIVGAFIASGGFVISIFAPSLVFLYFSFGIFSGLGLGLIYLPAIVSVGYYFEKYRAVATGIAVCGSGIGTFIFAPFSQFLLEEYNWQGAILIQAGILLNCVIFGAMFRPLESPKQRHERLGKGLKEQEGVLLKERAKSESPAEVDTQEPLLSEHKESDKSDGGEGSGKGEENNGHDEARRRRKRMKSPSITVTSDSGSVELLQSAKFTEEGLTKPTPQKRGSSLSLGHGRLASMSRSRSSLPTASPMSRKDIFYSASLLNIPMYRSDHSLYVTSVTSLPHMLPQGEERDVSLLCRCLSAETRANMRQMFDPTLLKDKIFLLFVVSNFLTSIGFNTPFIFLPDRALVAGISKSKATFLLSIIGIANTAGRVVFGLLSDYPRIRSKRLYLYNGALTLCGVATAMNALFDSYGLLVLYACIFGVFIGAYVAMTSVILVDLLGLDKLTNSFGILLLFQGLATLAGPPIAGATFDETGSYSASFAIIGTMIAISGVMLFVIPCMQRHIEEKKGISKADFDLGKRFSSMEFVSETREHPSV